MSHAPCYDFLLGKKLELADIFCENPGHIIAKAMEVRILTRRERNNLNWVFRPWDTVCDFLDKVMGKGEGTCKIFLNVLRDERIVLTYPELLSLPHPTAGVPHSRHHHHHHHHQDQTHARTAPYRLPTPRGRSRSTSYGSDISDYDCICAALRVERAQSV